MTRTQNIAMVSLLVSLMGLASLALAQSGTRSPPPARSSSPRTKPIPKPMPKPVQGSAAQTESPFEDRLWKFLQQAQYRNWAPLPGVVGEVYDGSDPHGDKVKLYANRTAVAATDMFPLGSTLVQESYDSTGLKLMSVTVMHRIEGFNPAAGDWHWTKYEANGTVSTMNGKRVSGRVSTCIDCHKTAGGDDYVFANDR